MKHAQNILLFVCSCMLVLLLTEIVVRLFFLTSMNFPQWPLYNVDFSKPIRFLPDTRASYIATEYQFSIASNAHGRRDRFWEKEELSNSQNIVFIGDSFVLGYGVSEEATIPHLLEQLFYRDGYDRKVFNFGMGGSISLREYRELLEEVNIFNIEAKQVIVGIFIGNDFITDHIATRGFENTSIMPLDSSAKPRISLWHLHSFDLLKRRVSQSVIITDLVLRLGEFFGVNFYNTQTADIFLKDPPDEQKKQFYAILNQALEIASDAKLHSRCLYFVIFPNKIQVENYDSINSSFLDARKPNQMIDEFCTQHQLRCFDLLDPLLTEYKSGRRNIYYAKDRHFTQEGNWIAAQEIYQFIKNQEECAT